MNSLKYRLRACIIHFSISLAIVVLAAWLVFGVWYPYPYGELSGGRSLFLLVVGVDIVLGPLITLMVFNREKTRRHLAMDLTIVGMLQLAALCYGLWTVFMARPVHMVFEYHRMTVVHAVDVDLATLSQAPSGLQSLPLSGPSLLSLRAFRSANENFDSTMQALAGTAQAAQPALWQSYGAARGEILRESKPVTELRQRFPAQVHFIDQAIEAAGRPLGAVRSLPLLSRQMAWTVLIDADTAQPIGYLPIDSF